MLLSKLLARVPGVYGKAASIALPILITALSQAKQYEEDPNRLRSALEGAAFGTLFTGYPSKWGRSLIRSARGIPQREAAAAAEAARGAAENLAAQRGMAVGQGLQEASEAAGRTGEVGRLTGLLRGRMGQLTEGERVPLGPEMGPRYPAEMDIPGLRTPMQEPGRGFFREFPGIVHGPGPTARAVGMLEPGEMDPYLSRRVRRAGLPGTSPFIHSADYGQWQAWKDMAARGEGPLEGVSPERVRETEQRMLYGGQGLQRVMYDINKEMGRLKPTPVAAPIVPSEPPTELAQAMTSSPVLPDALTKSPLYAPLREMVSRAFNQENPALAASQADAFLAQMTADMPPKRITETLVGLGPALGKGRQAEMDPGAAFATVMRAFGKMPSVAAAGRAGVKTALEQAAQGVREAERTTAPFRTIGDVLGRFPDVEDWSKALRSEEFRKAGFNPDSYTGVGLLTLLHQNPEYLKLPSSALPRVIAQIASQNEVPIANMLDRAGLERHLGYLFQGRLAPEMLAGLSDDSVRAAVRSAETLLMEGSSIERASDMAAMHLGAPNAARLLLLTQQAAWKHATQTGDVRPVYLKALTAAVGKFGLGAQDVMRLAENIAAKEGTSVDNALGYLTYKMGIPAANIDNKVAQQYLSSLYKRAGTDPAIAEIFQEMQGSVPQMMTRRPHPATEMPDIGIDQLIPRTSRALEEEHLLQDPIELLKGVISAGKTAQGTPETEGVIQALENALAEAAEKHVSFKGRRALVARIGKVLRGSEAPEAKVQKAREIIRGFWSGIGKGRIGE